MTDYTELKRMTELQHSLGHAYSVSTPSIILALIAENERLRNDHGDMVLRNKVLRERRDLAADRISCHDQVIALQAERDQLKAENEAQRKDAERYRWLREYHRPESEAPFICQQRLMFGKLYYAGPLVAGALDREVDSAMGKGEQSEIHHTSWALVHEPPPTCAQCGVKMFTGIAPQTLCNRCNP